VLNRGWSFEDLFLKGFSYSLGIQKHTCTRLLPAKSTWMGVAGFKIIGCRFSRIKESKNINTTTFLNLSQSYDITIHKSQGSEFGAVIIPILTQHFKMLFRNLIYMGLTSARKLAALVGTRKALAMAVKNLDINLRQTYLKEHL
jgi:hypothetical protein